MDNMIGTNEIGMALGLDSDSQQEALLAAAVEQQFQDALLGALVAQDALYHDAYGMVGAPDTRRIQMQRVQTQTGKGKGSGKTGKGPGMGVPSGKAQALMQTYKRGAANVQGAADNAKKQGTKTVSVAAAYRPGKPLAVVAGVDLDGIVGIVNDSVLGVTPKKLTPKQIEAVKAHTSAIDRTRAAAMEATKAGNRAIAAGKKAGDVAKRVKPVLDAAAAGKPAGKRGVLGIVGLYDACGVDGALCIDAWGFSPGQPGYDPTTDPDSPLYAGNYSSGPIIGFEADPTLYTPERWGLPPYLPLYTAPAWDKATGIDTSENPDPNLTFVPADNPFTDIGGANPHPDLQQPLKGGGKLSQEDAKVTWDTPPAGAIIWDGSGRLPNSLGSYSAFYGPKKGSVGMFGAVWGYSADGWQNGEKKWTLRFGQSNDFMKNDNRDDLGDSDAAAAKAVYQQDPEKHGDDGTGKDKRVTFGPLIGNPNGPLAGLQYARTTGQWFWQAGNAPAEYLVQANATIKDLNAAAVKAANDEVNKANKTLREANDVILKTDNATIDALNANTAQLVNEMAEALIKERAAIELQREKDAAADESTVSDLNRRTAEDQQKFDTQQAQQQLEESARASQLETDLARSLQEQEAQQAQFERQYALAQQQAENQFALMQQQMAAQMAPMQMQQDMQLMQMLMQQQPQQQPQMQQSQMDALLLQMLLQQGGGFDQSQQGGFEQGFDPNAYYAGFETLQEPQQQGGFDPSQLPGSFDMSAYYW